MKKNILSLTIFAILVLFSCKKDKEPEPGNNNNNNGGSTNVPELVFKFKFDSTQARLDNLGAPSSVASGNAAQSPKFNLISSHYIELTPNALTAMGGGQVLYHAPETTAGGTNAIDFSQSIKVAEGDVFKRIPISTITPGTYEYLRVSLSYQNYDIKYKYGTYNLTGTLASFVGFNTYLTHYTINTQNVNVNANKLQGYWGFETMGSVFEGQAPATTVPNPLFATSPIPAGSCVVTGQFASPLVITGAETNDIVITISLSTNKSFEWEDDDADGKYSPAAGDTVVDMGLRGLIPIVN